MPSLKEPAGLLRTDGKRPDGVTQVPWRAGKCITWDVTVADTLAQSYIRSTAAVAGSAAEGAATRKQAKYSNLTDRMIRLCAARLRDTETAKQRVR